MKCTGISASWCPIGDCTCADPDDKNDDDCPLHSGPSPHGTLDYDRIETVWGTIDTEDEVLDGAPETKV